jgi:hypothetical protein
MNVNLDISVITRPLRKLLTELKDRRLWPFAAALLVAIVAVPVALSNSSSPSTATQVPQPTPPPAQATSLPTISEQTAPSHASPTGSARDPFTQQKSTSSTSTTTTTTTTAPATSPTPTSSVVNSSNTTATASAPVSSSPSSSPTQVSTVSVKPIAATKTVTYYYDAVDLLFGPFGGKLRTYKNASRLRIFPSGSNPVVVYLGLKRDAKTAVFLVKEASKESGEGSCLPSASACDFLDLKVGQTELFLTPSANGTLSLYELKVLRVRLVTVPSAAAAAKMAQAHVSRAGQKLVGATRKLAPDIPWPSYSSKTGFLFAPVARIASVAQPTPDIHLGPSLR